jgi:uncharacterized cupin superfamily protein
MQLDRIDLGDAAGTQRVGVARLKLDPGGRSSPVHAEFGEEEIFYVLGGSGLSWQDGKTYEIGSEDAIVHKRAWETHTLIAGPDGLDVLAFGERAVSPASYLPRAGVLRMGATIDLSTGGHPWDREAEAGELELPEPITPRLPSIVNRSEVAAEEFAGATFVGFGVAGGSEHTGLSHSVLPPGAEGAPPHCHSSEEEIFIVLEGDGVLKLWPTPGLSRLTGGEAQVEEHPIRSGHVVSRLPATRVAHSFVAGPGGMTYLAYGTRDPNDIVYYPRSNKINFRGVGIIARLDSLDYFDGE